MSEILTREQMIQQMNVVATRAIELLRHAKARGESSTEMQSAMQKESISEETYRLILDAYLAGFTTATQPWMDILKKFKGMPLYNGNSRHQK